MTDLRTADPLGFLILAGNYNSEHVRSLMLQVHDMHGLPRFGYYFEKGVWAARLIKGEEKNRSNMSWFVTEHGLQDGAVSLEIRNATTPMAKPIEGTIRILQEMMRKIPGFVGFNERDDCYERIQALIAKARRGDPEALKAFPTMEEWTGMVQAVLNRFADKPQKGKMLEGKSPRQAWTEVVEAKKLKRLPDETRYVLATHHQRCLVKPEGIFIRIRSKPHLYYNKHTGQHIGEYVQIYYNIENPKSLVVRDPKLGLHFAVDEVSIPAMAATAKELQETSQLKADHMSFAKGIFRAVKQPTAPVTARVLEQTQADKDFGKFVHRDTANHETQRQATAERDSKLCADAAATGIPREVVQRYPDRARLAAEFRKRAMAERINRSQGHD